MTRVRYIYRGYLTLKRCEHESKKIPYKLIRDILYVLVVNRLYMFIIYARRTDRKYRMFVLSRNSLTPVTEKETI